MLDSSAASAFSGSLSGRAALTGLGAGNEQYRKVLHLNGKQFKFREEDRIFFLSKPNADIQSGQATECYICDQNIAKKDT